MKTKCIDCGKSIKISRPIDPRNPPVCWKDADPEIHLDTETKATVIPMTERELR